MKHNIGIIRLSVVTGVMAVMFLILIGRLYQLQILNGTNDADSPVLKTEKQIIEKAPEEIFMTVTENHWHITGWLIR
ncbi:hypothetical protein Ana3638_00495 [Anaerocolumna sedimenticola]|uniref:Uncharacterized protein n=1 Tax=Anaerocolumna sedimenticola TaxID=2696063 RepID=A0A6P1THF5_9FIRM|nr:hypothetical protein [Anaerocolumna sedimenticola]QHQ59461.1 hypothetical protein Ana3638_00495 [Anaerocolumna sedimenticola]